MSISPKHFNELVQSKPFKRALLLVGLLIVILISFGVGVFVGYHKAQFSYAWSENYHRHFGGPPEGIFGFTSPGSPPPEFMNAHGTFGSVLSVDVGSSTITIEGQDKMEKTMSITSSTILREDRETILLGNIPVGSQIVVIGEPDSQGQIEARLVRVLLDPTQK